MLGWQEKTKLLMVSNKEESLQALGGNFSFSPPPSPELFGSQEKSVGIFKASYIYRC